MLIYLTYTVVCDSTDKIVREQLNNVMAMRHNNRHNLLHWSHEITGSRTHDPQQHACKIAWLIYMRFRLDMLDQQNIFPKPCCLGHAFLLVYKLSARKSFVLVIERREHDRGYLYNPYRRVLVFPHDTYLHFFSVHQSVWNRCNIIIFRSITMLCRFDNILQNILHIHNEYEEYSVEYC